MSRAGYPRKVPDGSLLVKDIGILATLHESLGELVDAAIYCEGNEIVWVGSTKELPEKYGNADTVLSMPDRVMAPGLVNTHHHMYQCLTRCCGQNELVFEWQLSCFPGWAHLTGDDVHISALTAMAELILSGCTTSSDFLYVFPNDVTLDDTIRAAREIGIRFQPVRGALSKGKSQGGLPPDSLVEKEDAILVDMARCIKEFHDDSKFAMLRIALGPTSPYTVTDDLMRAAAKLARSHTGVRLHTHIAENVEDTAYTIKQYGVRPGKYLETIGWDKDDVWLAHCTQLNDEEIAQWGASGICTAHCACSNMRLGDGICPVRKLLDAGANVGLGVDGSASNDTGNMIGDVRQALLLARCRGDADALTAHEALRLGTIGGAINLGRQDSIGQIAPGYAADFVAWRTDTLAFAGAGHDLVAGLVFCNAGTVDLSVINGEIIVQDGKLLTIDLEAVIKEHVKRSEHITSYIKRDLEAYKANPGANAFVLATTERAAPQESVWRSLCAPCFGPRVHMDLQ